jgi:hypothetical protein
MEMRGTQMEILDRYLLSVRRHLPWLRQDDILAELRANLEAQLEDKEAELGRKFTVPEIEAWLKQLGPPLQVAARYQRQQYLIGPALFPIYRFVLRLALGWCAVIYAIVKTVEIVANGLGGDALLRAVAQLPWTLLITAATVTLVFAVIEWSGAKIPEKFAAGAAMGSDWPPGLVSPFDARPFDPSIDERKKPRTYAHAVVEVIFGWILLVWLLLVPHYPFLLMGPGAIYLQVTPYQLVPAWWTFYWCIVVLNLVELAWRLVDLLQNRWQEPHHAQHLVKKVLGLIPLLVVLAAPGRVLVVLKSPADTTHAAALAQINNGVYRGFEVIAAIVFLQLLWMIGRMSIEAYRRRLAAAR